jgi:hypothetical protein
MKAAAVIAFRNVMMTYPPLASSKIANRVLRYIRGSIRQALLSRLTIRPSKLASDYRQKPSGEVWVEPSRRWARGAPIFEGRSPVTLMLAFFEWTLGRPPICPAFSKGRA